MVTFSVSVHNTDDFTDMVAKGNLNEISVIVGIFDNDLKYESSKVFFTNKALSCIPKDNYTYEITYECIGPRELKPDVGIKFANAYLNPIKLKNIKWRKRL